MIEEKRNYSLIGQEMNTGQVPIVKKLTSPLNSYLISTDFHWLIFHWISTNRMTKLKMSQIQSWNSIWKNRLEGKIIIWYICGIMWEYRYLRRTFSAFLDDNHSFWGQYTLHVDFSVFIAISYNTILTFFSERKIRESLKE